MEFLVADAERLFAEGGKVKNLSFWGYKIMTRSTLPSYRSPPLFPRVVVGPSTNFITGEGYVDYCVWHRYSDFEWLVQQLEHAFPGIIAPPIPDKDADGTVDKLSDLLSSKDSSEASRDNALVQQRIRHFQLFFDNLLTLVETHEHEVVKAFLTMEEPEWLQYKEKATLASKPQGWEAIKSKGFGLLSRLSAIGDKKPVAFPEGTPIATLRTQQQHLGDALRACAMHMLYIKKYGHYTPELKTEASDSDKQANKDPANDAPRIIPPPLIYNGHFVCEVTDRNRQGVVRHVEGTTAWVDWGNAQPLARVPLVQLCYPRSGVTDPTMFAAQELGSQLESFCTYLSLRPEARQLEKVTDLCYFWSRYSHAVVRVTDILQQELEDLTIAEKEVGKKKDGAEKVELAAKAAAMRQRYETGCSALRFNYDNFRVRQKKALLDIAFLFGGVSVNVVIDEDWEQRLLRADAALPLLFEPPQEVVDTLAHESKSAAFVEYVPPPPQRPAPSAVPSPQPQQQPLQPQQQENNDSMQRADAPFRTDGPVNRSLSSPPEPNASPVSPQKSQQRFYVDPTVPSAPPPEDVSPPPPPPPTADDVSTRPTSNSGFDENWQRAPRTWSHGAANPSTAVAPEDDMVPPPPPPHEA